MTDRERRKNGRESKRVREQESERRRDKGKKEREREPVAAQLLRQPLRDA